MSPIILLTRVASELHLHRSPRSCHAFRSPVHRLRLPTWSSQRFLQQIVTYVREIYPNFSPKRVKFCTNMKTCTKKSEVLHKNEWTLHVHTTIRRNTRLEDHVRMSMACASGFSDSSYTVLILNQEPSGRLIDNSM